MSIRTFNLLDPSYCLILTAVFCFAMIESMSVPEVAK